jgi:hypothetical protein
VDESDTTEMHHMRRLRCAALIAFVALVVMVWVLVGVYVIAL